MSHCIIDGNILNWIINWLSGVADGQRKVVNGYRWSRRVKSGLSVASVLCLILFIQYCISLIFKAIFHQFSDCQLDSFNQFCFFHNWGEVSIKVWNLNYLISLIFFYYFLPLLSYKKIMEINYYENSWIKSLKFIWNFLIISSMW